MINVSSLTSPTECVLSFYPNCVKKLGDSLCFCTGFCRFKQFSMGRIHCDNANKWFLFTISFRFLSLPPLNLALKLLISADNFKVVKAQISLLLH